MKFYNWENRPAVVTEAGKAYAIMTGSAAWVAADATEIQKEGTPVSPSMFGKIFPNVPPFSI